MADEKPVDHSPSAANDDTGSEDIGDIGDAALREGAPGAPLTDEAAGKQKQANIDAARKAGESGRKPI